MPSPSSVSAFVTTLIFNLVVAFVLYTLFHFLRNRKKYDRIYNARTLPDIDTLPEELRVPRPSSGYMHWISQILVHWPHSKWVQYTGVDGYFFLRYIGVNAALSLTGVVVLFPILLPVNATNGKSYSGFEILSMANVTNQNRYFAHAFLSWIYFGLVIFFIYKELYYYVVFRHAMQTTPLYDCLLSSRTVGLSELSGNMGPGSLIATLQKEYPQIERVFVGKKIDKLEKHVALRAKHATRTEDILTSLIYKAYKKHEKTIENERKNAQKKQEAQLRELEKTGAHRGRAAQMASEGSQKNFQSNLDSFRQNDLDFYIPFQKRPKERTGLLKFGWIPVSIPYLTGEKHDKLEYSIEQVKDLTEKIQKEQEEWELNEDLPIIFVEFPSQHDAQECYQSIPRLLNKKSYGKRFIGHSPDDIIWKNIYQTKRSRRTKKILSNTFLTLLMCLWALPVIVVGCISNVNFLMDKVYFLRFLRHMPNFLMGIITGLLPSLALAALLSLVPPIITIIGKYSGVLTQQDLNLYVHKWYYAFQIIQGFLVIAGVSSATATVTPIINSSGSAMVLLAENIPKSSNFYITYFLLQGLLTPSLKLSQISKLIMNYFLSKVASSPRQKWKRYNKLSTFNMATSYPAIELLFCIMICYSIIAPIILFFSTCAFVLIFISYLYNCSYVNALGVDLKGINYPRAILDMFYSLYLSEIFLLALFIMHKSWGPMVLEFVFIIPTVFCHIWFTRRFTPLFESVPLSTILYARGAEDKGYPQRDEGLREIKSLAKRDEDDVEEEELGVIRPATRKELQRAHIIPEDDKEDSDESNSVTPDDEVCDDKSANNDTSDTPINASCDKDSASSVPQIWSTNDKGPSYSLHDASTITQVETGRESQRKDKSRRNSYNKRNSTSSQKTKKSTFVEDDSKFQKYRYPDVASLLEAGAQDNGPFDTQGPILIRAREGNIFSQARAMVNDDEAFPANVLATLTTSKRIVYAFNPSKVYTFENVRLRLPIVMNTTIDYKEEFLETAYCSPAVTDQNPVIWLAKDRLGITERLLKHEKGKGLNMSDAFTGMDEKGRATFSFHPPDFEPYVKK